MMKMRLLLLSLLQVTLMRASSEQSNGLRSRDGEETFHIGDKVYDCDQGCTLSSQLNGPPVCGDNDVTYFNECLAVCQGVNVASVGECQGDRPMNDDSYEMDGTVTKEDLERYQDEKFFFVAKRKFAKGENLSKAFNDDVNEGPSVSYEPMNNEKKNMFALRVDSQGNEYQAELKKRLFVEPSPFNLPLDERDDGNARRLRGRKLGIVGSDSRYKVCLHDSCYPYSAIGEFDTHFTKGGCSGTVISRTSVLTAAHCLYYNGLWSDRKWFAPGRYNSKGVIKEPYGIWEYESRTIFTEWSTTQQQIYDIAVVKFKSKDGYYIGDLVGWMGIAPTTNNSAELQSATVTGYPYDKNDGEMWSSGQCVGGFVAGYHSVTTYNNCDSTAAESGSGLLDLRTRTVYGVHSSQISVLLTTNPDDAYTNVGIILHPTNIATIKSWAGLI